MADEPHPVDIQDWRDTPGLKREMIRLPNTTGSRWRSLKGFAVLLITIIAGVVGVVLVREGGAIGGLIFGGSLLVLDFGMRRGRQLRAKSAAKILAQDARAPVLYLRPFEEDNKLVRRNPGLPFLVMSFEQDLARALKRIGPVIAIGSPSEDPSLPELGAARFHFREGDWQAKASELMQSAQLIVLHVGRSRGVLWEVRRAIELGLADKLAICIPNTPHREQLCAEFRALTADLFPKLLPVFDHAQLICFKSDWTPLLLQGNRAIPSGATQLQRSALGCIAKVRR